MHTCVLAPALPPIVPRLLGTDILLTGASLPPTQSPRRENLGSEFQLCPSSNCMLKQLPNLEGSLFHARGYRK